jgi:hypothetical protein
MDRSYPRISRRSNASRAVSHEEMTAERRRHDNRFDSFRGHMRITALVAATSLCFAYHPLAGQETRAQGAAVTRVSTPLREAPSVESRVFATIPPKTSVNVTSCTDGWCAVKYQQLTGHAIQVFLRFPPVAVSQARSAPSGRGYTNSQGEWVPSPMRTSTGQPPAGASARCRDDTYSFSRSRRGTCSHHGGVAQWL